MTHTQQPRPGAQTIYSADGEILFLGQWEPKSLFRAVTGDNEDYWHGKRVLDIGANTFGLSIELARAGAEVVAIEPDPHHWIKNLIIEIVKDVISREHLQLITHEAGLWEAKQFGTFDTVLCLGLVYHFRDQQFVIDWLSTLEMVDLIISNQTHPGNQLAVVNRMDSSMPFRPDFWDAYEEPLSGWHPTHPMFVRMLQFAGFDNVTPLTDPAVNFPEKPLPGVTNSAYYRATKQLTVDPIASRFRYHPR